MSCFRRFGLALVLSFLLVACKKSESTESKFGSDAFEAMADRAVAALAENDIEEFKHLLSPDLVKRTEREYGTDGIERIISERYVPFFDDFVRLDPNSNNIPTADQAGHKGLAFVKTFLNSAGDQKPFIIYILDEGDKLTVGNLLINKTFKDINP